MQIPTLGVNLPFGDCVITKGKLVENGINKKAPKNGGFCTIMNGSIRASKQYCFLTPILSILRLHNNLQNLLLQVVH